MRGAADRPTARFRSVLALAAVLVVVTMAPEPALAEVVECPSCWGVVEDDSCECPHCGTALPGRVCPAAPSTPAPAPSAESPGDALEQDDPREPPRRRPRRPRRRPRPDEQAAPRRGRPAATDEDRPGDRPERLERRRERRGEDRPERLERRRERRPRREGPRAAEPAGSRRAGLDEDGAEVAGELRATDRRRRPREAREGGGEADRGRARPRLRGRPSAPPAAAEPAAVSLSRGPAFLLGYRYFGLYDWTGQGHTHAVGVEGFPLVRILPWLRLGLGADLGFRLLEAHTDWTFRGAVSLGVQYPWRVTPYGAVSLGGGMVYRQRFGQGLVDGLFTAGLEAGITWPATRTFVLDLGLGYLYAGFDGLDFHSFTIRLALGW